MHDGQHKRRGTDESDPSDETPAAQTPRLHVVAGPLLEQTRIVEFAKRHNYEITVGELTDVRRQHLGKIVNRPRSVRVAKHGSRRRIESMRDDAGGIEHEQLVAGFCDVKFPPPS